MRYLAIIVLIIACTKKGADKVGSPESGLAQKGRAVYASNCIACHNADPKKDGALGPALFGSSKELIESRVMRAEYPAGYTPKRKTKVMVALPQLKNDLEALFAYLNQD